jgi:hypothetical protein
MSDTETANITTGELSRAVTLIRGDIKDVKKDISERPTIADYKDLRAEVEKKATTDALGWALSRIKELEDWQKWAMRIGVPALIGVIFNIANTLDGKIPG